MSFVAVVAQGVARRLVLAAALAVFPAVHAFAQLQPPGLVGGAGGDPGQLTVRADQLESQVRTLTGQVEQLTFQLQQLQEQMRRMSEDVEYRFQALGAAPSRQGAVQQQGQAAPRQQGQFAAQGAPQGQGQGLQGQPMDQSGAGGGQYAAQDLSGNGSQNLGAPPQDLGTLSTDGPMSILPPGQDINQQDFAQPQDGLQTPGSVALAVPEDPQTAYDVAYAFILQRDYGAAEQAFHEFLQNYPQHALAGNAQYWLGESYYARKQYREAADAFLAGYQNYQSSPKGAETLVRLAASLSQLGQKDAACASLDEVGRSYPQATKGVKDLVKQERKRAGC